MMDPSHLKSDEVQYELYIRHIEGLTDKAKRQAALRSVLIREDKALEVAPVSNRGKNASEEIQKSYDKIVELKGFTAPALQNGDQELLRYARSRFLHVQERVNRVNPETLSQQNEKDSIKMAVQKWLEAIDRKIEGRLIRVDSKGSVMSKQSYLLQDFSTSRGEDKLVEISEEESDEFSEDEVEGAMGGLNVTEQRRTSSLPSTSMTKNYTGTIPKSTKERELAGSQSTLKPFLFGDLNHSMSENDKRSQPPLGKDTHNDFTMRNTILDKDLGSRKSVNHTNAGTNASLDSSPPRSSARKEMDREHQFKELNPFSNPFEPKGDRQARDHFQRYEIRNYGNNPNQLLKENAQGVPYGNPPINFRNHETREQANTFRQGQNHNQTVRPYNDRVQATSSFRNTNFSKRRADDQEHRYPRERYPIERYPMERYPHFRDDREEDRRPEIRNRQQTRVNDNFQDNRFRGQNFGVFRPNRKYKPVHAWSIRFDGDSGLSLTDFIDQVEMLATAEQIDQRELLSSIVHLLTGRAFDWYRSNYRDFYNWEEFKRLIREEFIPENYELMMLWEIETRIQGKNETFSSYFNSMKRLFNCLRDPLSEDYKLYVIRKGLNANYAQSIASARIQDLHELSAACKRTDTTNLMLERQKCINISRDTLLEPGISFPTRNTRRFVHALNTDQPEVDEEIFAYKNKTVDYSNGQKSGNVRCCWNCGRDGHDFNACERPRRGSFCYRCGERNVITQNCNRCKGRENLNREQNSGSYKREGDKRTEQSNKVTDKSETKQSVEQRSQTDPGNDKRNQSQNGKPLVP